MSTSREKGEATAPADCAAPAGWVYRLLPVALYSLLTLIVLYPASLAPGTYVMEARFFFGELFNIFLVGDQLMTDQSLVYATEMLNHPDGGYLVLIAWSNIVLSLVLKTVTSLLAAYNLSVMIMLVLGGLGAYMLMRHLTKDYWAAMVGGVIFGFNPYILAIVNNSQIGYSNHVWIPLYILFLIKFYAELRVKHLLLLTACAVSALLNSPYYAVFCWVFTGLYPVLLLLQARARWKKVLLATALVFSVVPAAQLLPYRYLSSMEQDERYQLLPTPKCQLHRVSEVIRLDSAVGPNRSIYQNSSNLLSFFIPLDKVPPPGMEFLLNYLGLSTALLLLLLWVYRWRVAAAPRVTDGPAGWRPAYWWALAIGFGLLSLGPYLSLNGELVLVGDRQPIPLPFYLLWKYLPFFHRMCTPYRFTVMLLLLLAIIASFGLAQLFARLAGRGKAVAFSAIVTVLFLDYLLVSPVPWPMGWYRVEVPRVYEELALDREQYALVEFPYSEPNGPQFWEEDPKVKLPMGWNERLTYFQTVHRKKLGIKMAQLDLPPLYKNSLLVKRLADIYAGRASLDGAGGPARSGPPPAPARDGTARGVCGGVAVDAWLVKHDFRYLILHESVIPPAELACIKRVLGDSAKLVRSFPADKISWYSLRR